MSIKINYSNVQNSGQITNYVLFVEENFKIDNIKNFSNIEISYIKDVLKKNDLKKNIISFDLNSKRKIILINVKKNLKNSDIENLGAEFYNFIKDRNLNELSLNSESTKENFEKDFIGHFLLGLKLKSYEFNIYKSKKNNNLFTINILGKKNNFTKKMN